MSPCAMARVDGIPVHQQPARDSRARGRACVCMRRRVVGRGVARGVACAASLATSEGPRDPVVMLLMRVGSKAESWGAARDAAEAVPTAGPQTSRDMCPHACVADLFMEADVDQSGTLDRKEFGTVLRCAQLSMTDRQVRQVMAEADDNRNSSTHQLTQTQIRQVMAEADDNDDGVIQYEEFIPIMVDILQGLKAGAEASAARAALESAIRDEAGDLLRGLPQGELDAMVEKVFRRADANGNGMLEKHEFRTALLKAGVGFTRKDINLVMSQVDVDDDGLISYQEFVPLCFQILVERFKDELLTNQVLNSHDSLQEMLLAAFQEADVEGGGTLSQRTLKSLLTQLSYNSLGLTALQVLSLVGQAPLNPDGLVPYVPFVPTAAAMVRSLYDVQSLKLRLAAAKEATASGGLPAVGQVDVPGLRAFLEDAFVKVGRWVRLEVGRWVGLSGERCGGVWLGCGGAAPFERAWMPHPAASQARRPPPGVPRLSGTCPSLGTARRAAAARPLFVPWGGVSARARCSVWRVPVRKKTGPVIIRRGGGATFEGAHPHRHSVASVEHCTVSALSDGGGRATTVSMQTDATVGAAVCCQQPAPRRHSTGAGNGASIHTLECPNPGAGSARAGRERPRKPSPVGPPSPADIEGTGILEEGVVMDVLSQLGALAPAHLSLSAAHVSIARAAVDSDADGNVEWGELVLFICEAIEHLERELYVQSYAAGGAGGMQEGGESYAEGDEDGGYDGEEGGRQEY
ncbi:MAG: hypothetical protein WDW36_008209 [Sanguina aurantia]